MIRATSATWLNYATTIAFQVLFAAAFGSSGEAGAFVIAFAAAVSIGGVFVTTATTNVLPRMVASDGSISRPALRVLAGIGGVVIVSALAVGLTAVPVSTIVGPLVGVSPELAATLLVAAAVFLGTVGVAGILGSVVLIRGHRFLPAFAPAFPSILGGLYLIITPEPAVTGAFAALAAGGVIQVLIVGAFALLPRFSPAARPPLRLGRIATLTAVILLLQALLPPLQRILAATIDPAGAAQFDYAARGMQVALQLLLGGLVIAVLPDWTVRFSQAGVIHSEVTRTTAVATVLLMAAAGFALVAAEPVVRLVYERGAFLAADTEMVVLITRILVPGFVAEGLWLVMCQGLLATGRTDLVLRVWAIRFAALLGLTLVLGWTGGAVGVAVAHSVSNLVATGFGAAFSARAGIFRDGAAMLGRAVRAGGVTTAVAIGLWMAGQWIPPLIAGIAVLGVAVGASHVAGLTPAVLTTLRGRHPVSIESAG
jgi:putative peptidoglycan lipid II flippase